MRYSIVKSSEPEQYADDAFIFVIDEKVQEVIRFLV